MRDRTILRFGLDSVAESYDQHCGIFDESGAELGERLLFLQQPPKKIVDVGCRTGGLSRLMQSKFPDSLVFLIDESREMCVKAKRKMTGPYSRATVSEIDQLPLDSESADLIVSNLASSFYDPKTFISECFRVLRTDGVLLFSMFGMQSFQELRHACIKAGIREIHKEYPELHDIGNFLLSTGFADPVVDVEYKQPLYPDLPSLIEHLDNIGICSLLIPNAQLQSVKSVQSQLTEQFQELGAKEGITLTLAIIYGIAWKKQVDMNATRVRFHR